MKFSITLRNDVVIVRAMQAYVQPDLRVHTPPIHIHASEKFAGLSYQELRVIAPGVIELQADGQLLSFSKPVDTQAVPPVEATT
jgi:hypothetical protein